MTHQNTLLTQTQMCPKGFDDEHKTPNQVFFGRDVPILSGESYYVALTT